ncbi:MAG: hypothetical protein IKT52_08545 [Oscillospiraceae bacterium]|nr:hypothetical protein [Oscillospiraceae bacterium]
MKTDGSVIIDTKIGTDGMEKGFEAIKKEMSSVGVAVEDLGGKIKKALSGGASVSVQQAFAKVKSLKSQLDSVTAEFNAAVSQNDDKGAERLGVQRAAIYDRLESARFRLATVVTSAARKEEAAETRAARKALKEKERAYKKATKGARAFGKRLTSIMASALVFNVISQGLRSVTQYFGKALKSNQKFADAWSKLKGAALTAIQPIYEVLLPILTTAVEVATKLVLLLGRAFASLAGKSADQMKKNAEALNDQANATEKAGKAAKDAKKHLAGFDELNVLGNNDSSESTDTANFKTEDIDINSKLSEMASLTSAAVFALGIILTLSGANIPIGLGMIVLGGLALYKSIEESWGSVESNVVSTAEAIALIGGAVTLAIGIIICFACPTHLGLGLGLVIGGAALLGSEVALNWNAIEEALKDPVVAAVAAIGGAFLIVLGILLCCAQDWGFGIGFIVAGATFLGGTIAVNWNAIKDFLKSPLGAAVGIIAGAVLIVIGIFACFAQNWVLGIGLIVAGAAFLVTTIALNWNAIKEALKGPIGGVVAVLSSALLVIGAIIAFSGAGLPLGIALMAAGAVGLATTAALNWSSIKDKVKGVFAGILSIISGASLVLGVLLCLSGVGIGAGLALIFAGIAGSKAAWSLSDNPITRFVKNMANGIIKIINKVIEAINDMFHIQFDGLKIAGKQIIPKIDTKLISLPKIPMLAQGAVIPPNREFMAVLGDQKHGTNIEAPLETIKQALAEVLALQESGETVVTVNFTGDLAQLARVLKPAIETETRRRGGSLAKGATF